MGYAPDMIILKPRSRSVTQKWYATLGHPEMHPHTIFAIPTSKSIGKIFIG